MGVCVCVLARCTRQRGAPWARERSRARASPVAFWRRGLGLRLFTQTDIAASLTAINITEANSGGLVPARAAGDRGKSAAARRRRRGGPETSRCPSGAASFSSLGILGRAVFARPGSRGSQVRIPGSALAKISPSLSLSQPLSPSLSLALERYRLRHHRH